MAITRRKAIKLGVSFGSGCIKFGNDEFAFCDALREFPQDGSYAAFKEAFDAIDVEAVEAAAAARAAQEAAADNGEATAAPEPAEAVPAQEVQETCAAASETPGCSAEEPATADAPADTADAKPAPVPAASTPAEATTDPQVPHFDLDLSEEEDEEEEAPLDPTLVNAIQAAQVYRKVCSRLALSEMYLQMTGIINTLSEGALPPVAELHQLEESYQALVEYLSCH